MWVSGSDSTFGPRGHDKSAAYGLEIAVTWWAHRGAQPKISINICLDWGQVTGINPEVLGELVDVNSLVAGMENQATGVSRCSNNSNNLPIRWTRIARRVVSQTTKPLRYRSNSFFVCGT